MADLDFMGGVTGARITVPVSAGQFRYLAETQVAPERPRTTHKVTVGPFALPGLWVVVAAQERHEPPESTYFVTLVRVEG